MNLWLEQGSDRRSYLTLRVAAIWRGGRLQPARENGVLKSNVRPLINRHSLGFDQFPKVPADDRGKDCARVGLHYRL